MMIMKSLVLFLETVVIATASRTCKNCCQAWEDPNCNAEHCWSWAHDHSQCDTNPDYMLQMCPEACASADSDPAEHINACKAWAAHGECKRSVKYMTKHCKNVCEAWASNEEKKAKKSPEKEKSKKRLSKQEISDLLNGKTSCGMEVNGFKLRNEVVAWEKKKIASACECSTICSEHPYWAWSIRKKMCTCYENGGRLEVRNVKEVSKKQAAKYTVRAIKRCRGKECPWDHK